MSTEQWYRNVCTLLGHSISKFFNKKKNARNEWAVTDCFGGNETDLWEKTVHQQVFGQFCQNRLWQKMFCGVFYPKANEGDKSIALWHWCLLDNFLWFVCSIWQERKSAIVWSQIISSDICKLSFKIRPLQQNLLLYDQIQRKIPDTK